MRTILPIVAATALSWGHAVATARVGLSGPAAADGYVAALRAADAWASTDLRPIVGLSDAPVGVLGAWAGLWLLVFGKSLPVAVAALLPFHLLAATGLWVGGSRLGGTRGGAWALVGGLGAAGVLAHAAMPVAAFPVFACAAFAGGTAAAGLRRWALAGVAAALLLAFAGLAGGPAASDGGPAGLLPASAGFGPLLERLVTLAQPALLLGVLAALLLRGDALVLRLLGAAAALLTASALPGGASFTLAALPLLTLAAAPLAATAPGAPALPGRAVSALTALAALQLLFFHLDFAAWPARPAALRALTGEPPPLDGPLDWLAAQVPAGAVATVATLVDADPLHPGLLAVAAAERALPLRFVAVDAAHPLTVRTDLGLVLRRTDRATRREGWRAQLPPPALTLPAGEALRVDLFDRGLPPESLLATPEEAEARNHPREQALWVYADGAERGPLLPHASSPAVLRTPTGWEVLFVRDQALWRASSPDGLAFSDAAPLRDATGPIAAFDPAILTLPDGRLRLFAAELTGTDPHVDPAAHPTRVVSWTGASLDALVRDPGVHLEGPGLVDPSVLPGWAAPDGRWALYATEARSRVVRATSPDGERFQRDPAYVLDGVTVPEVLDAATLLVQRQVMGWSVFATVPTVSNTTPLPTLLDLCGTGPALAAGRLYYTRAAEACPEPVAIAARRAPLDALLAAPR